MFFRLSRNKNRRDHNGKPTDLLTALEYLDDTITTIANLSQNPSDFAWTLAPLGKKTLVLRISIGSEINPKEVGEWNEEGKIFDFYQGKFKPWSISLVLLDNDSLPARINEATKLLDDLMGRFNQGAEWDSLRDSEEILDILSEWY